MFILLCVVDELTENQQLLYSLAIASDSLRLVVLPYYNLHGVVRSKSLTTHNRAVYGADMTVVLIGKQPPEPFHRPTEL